MHSPLDTAEHPEKLRRVVIEPVSRVEGHGKVTILLDDQRKVHQVRLHIVEFRGFERFIQGRPYWEVPVMVQRLCGICPVSHHLAASKALDAVVGARTLTPAAERIRRLMHYGQILQSHALHFYHLASPDLLFGFDADPRKRNVVGVLAAYPDIARQGVLLRKYGQECIRVTAGKRVHGTGSIPGGVNKRVTAEERDELRRPLSDIRAWAQAGVALVTELHEHNRDLYEQFGTVKSSLLSIVGRDGKLDLYDGVLRARDAQGAIIFDGVEPKDYHVQLRENVRSWSYMKFPFIVSRGPEEGWYKVGPLARIQNCDAIGTPLAEAARQELIADSHGAIVHAPLVFHWARMIELLHAVEVIEGLLADPALLGDELVASGPRARTGVGIIEAPRGTLIHQYEVDEHDLVTMCNLIVSTTHNNQAMNEAIRQVARQHLDGHEPTEGLLNHIEVAIRAFDPCLSCATHALGKMPLAVEIVDAQGALVERLVRDGERL
ncbi:MAG: Ni/Fe hydrogenase subunit alpha [Polyangiaceae bacterium]|jgi:NAD-reducing hydrogenase large subunit|nr:Ni/Fe hydrogenase subunit alpha [Polyangiaceae bacterium]MBK8938487.1 Ni/Fe hydrogenase subunit alpha [Polyangiaceae bacterium]